jgi:hypothetical protein
MEINLKFKIILFSLIFYAEMVHPGAILTIDRVDLVNGQKIIFLSEQHIGEVEKSLDAKDVCLKQSKPLSDLFTRFIPRKRDHILYIEAHKTLRDYNRSMHTEQSVPLVGCEPSYLDRFYLYNIYGENKWDQLDNVKNFDERTKDDWWLLSTEDFFSQYFELYKQGGFNDLQLAQLKKSFFERERYNKNFDFKAYIKDFEKRLQALVARLESKMTPEDAQRVRNLVEWRMKNFAAFVNLVDKVTFINQPLFEFLFDYAQMTKNQFYPELEKLVVGQAEPITSTLDFVEFVNVIADLSLLDVILSDRHKVIIVSCGAEHADKVIKYFFRNNPRVSKISSLNMIDRQMLASPSYAAEQVVKFVGE